jgi:hypothetical protein
MLGLAMALSVPAAGDKKDTDKRISGSSRPCWRASNGRSQELRAALQAQQRQMERGAVARPAAVSSKGDSLRMRLYWVDVQKSKIEVFAGQSWSMLTPNWLGLSALPNDLFYSQLMDTNYQAGLRAFKTFNPVNSTSYESHGFGGSLNFNLEVAKNLHVISNNFISDGGGRWIFGLAPDLIVRPNGSLSPVHANSTVDGLALDPATNKWIGYGYPGSPSGQNRIVQEPSFGLTQTFWKDAKFGALQTILQYSYVSRDPWSVATGQPGNAHAHMIFADLRYVLPGSAPRVEK